MHGLVRYQVLLVIDLKTRCVHLLFCVTRVLLQHEVIKGPIRGPRSIELNEHVPHGEYTSPWAGRHPR